MGIIIFLEENISFKDGKLTFTNRMKVRLLAVCLTIRRIPQSYRNVVDFYDGRLWGGVCLGDICPKDYDDEDDGDINGDRMYK